VRLHDRIDPAQLARLGSLPIKARVIVEGALSGLHRAAVHGASVEFAEHKEYSPGDELRHVDWKAYAKLDRYYVKQFEQESQLTVYLVLDASASMAFSGGGIAKLAVQREAGSTKVDDSTVGGWIGGGIFWRLGARFNIGLAARVSRGQVTLNGTDTEAGGSHAGLILGWGWPAGK